MGTTICLLKSVEIEVLLCLFISWSETMLLIYIFLLTTGQLNVTLFLPVGPILFLYDLLPYFVTDKTSVRWICKAIKCVLEPVSLHSVRQFTT